MTKEVVAYQSLLIDGKIEKVGYVRARVLPEEEAEKEIYSK